MSHCEQGLESQVRPLWVLPGCFGKSWWVPVWGPPRLTPWGQWLQPWEENLVIDGLLLISECSVFPSFPHSFFQTLILLRYRKLIKAVLSCRKFVFLMNLSQELKRVIGNPSSRGREPFLKSLLRHRLISVPGKLSGSWGRGQRGTVTSFPSPGISHDPGKFWSRSPMGFHKITQEWNDTPYREPGE